MPADIVTNSPFQTRKVGCEISKIAEKGGVIGLTGELGSGKTILADGIFHGAGLSSEIKVVSPTYTIVNVYPGPVEMIHIDLYRVDRIEELETTGAREIIGNPKDAMVIVEWFDKFTEIWPQEFIMVKMEIKGLNRRKISIRRIFL